MTWARRKVTAARPALQRAAVIAALLPLAAGRAALRAQEPVEQLFPARPTGYVTDVAKVIDPATAARMEDLIVRLRGATGAEIAVVTLPTIGDREAAEVALAIGRRWGVGARAEIGDPRRNAGIVVLLVPRQEGVAGSGQLRIEVGQGLEGIVPDAVANQIYRRIMVPELAQGAYSEGLLAGVQALVSTIARGYGVSDSALTAYPPRAGSEQPPTIPWLPILLFVLFIILTRAGGRRRRRGIYWGGPWIGGGWGGRGGFGGGGGGGFGGFGGGGGFSGGGSGGRF